MSLPKVSVVLQNGQLGQGLQLADGIAGMIICGGVPPAVAPNFVYDTPFLLTSLSQCAQYGIVKGDANTGGIYKNIADFYAEAGDGSQLYVNILPPATFMADALNPANAHLSNLITYAQGKIRILAITKIPAAGYVPVMAGGLDTDVANAITQGQAAATANFGAYKPFRLIVAGILFDDTVADLVDLTLQVNNTVGVLLFGNDNSKLPAVGLALGREAKIPVQRKISRVKDGPINTIAGFIGTKAVDTGIPSGTLDLMDSKGYIIGRTFAGKSGFYFNGDHTATANTDDYSSLARGRVIDKASVIAYQTYVEELGDEVAIDATGRIASEVVMSLQKDIETQILDEMADEISGVSAFIDPTQDILATNLLNVTLKITPVGYNQNITVQLGFNNPALA